jgi:4-amino-4-deoxy-L-arabinose transferase-like glycosyltransferase
MSSLSQILRRLVPRQGLLLLLAVTFVKGLTWAAAVPVGLGPDELSHVALVQFIAENARLPNSAEIYRADEIVYAAAYANYGPVRFHEDADTIYSKGRWGPNEDSILDLRPEMRTSYDLQAYASAMFVPPLYHSLAAISYRLLYSADILSRIYAMRLTSVLLTVGLVWISYWVAREAFPEVPLTWLTVPIVVSFHPMVTFVGAIVNSDILLFLLLGIITWLLVRAMRRGLTLGISLGLGIATGLGLLTKPMILAYGLAMGVILLVLWLQRRQSLWLLVRLALLVPIVSLAISGWFLVRNQAEQGAPLYDNPYDNPHIVARNDPHPDLTAGTYWRDTFEEQLRKVTFRSYWGVFGWMDVPMPQWVYQVLAWTTRLTTIGVGLYAAGQLFRRHWSGHSVWVVLILVVLSVSLLPPMFFRAYVIARDTGFFGTSAQGRYLLGFCVAQALILVHGLTALVPAKGRRWCHALISLSVILLNMVALLQVVIPRYYL